VYSRWQKAITQATKRILPGYEIKTAGSLGDGGAFEDFSWWAAGVPSACLELFSESRYIPQTLAAKIFDWFTPQLLRQPQTNSQMRDSFLAYELFLYTMFDEASRLRSGEANKTELADRYP
jgi:hypothetical protein